MIRSVTKLFAAVATLGAALVAAPAAAQDCPCDCYFSSDCEPGNFCNWGSLPQEDSCFWRTPKPQGSPGANCEDEYDDWGQCDGICTESTAMSVYSLERVDRLIRGIVLWSNAMTSAAMNGGGHPNPHLLAQARDIGYAEPRMFDGMWRVAVEALTLARGPGFVIYPKDVEVFHSEQATVADLSADRDRVIAGNMAVDALIAEMREPGAGRAIVDRMMEAGFDELLDGEMFGRICRDEATRLDCMYTRLQDIAYALGQSGRSGDETSNSTGPSCTETNCNGDVDGNLVIDVDDLMQIILRFGFQVPEGHPADADGSGWIDVDDMIIVLTNWGPCG